MVDMVRIYPVRHKEPQFYFSAPKQAYNWLQKVMLNEHLNPDKFLLDKDRAHYHKHVPHLQWKSEHTAVSSALLRDYVLPKEALLMGPGRKDQEKCVLIIEGGRLLGYTYFYLASDGLDKPFLKKRMVHLDHNNYNASVVHHYLESGYLKSIEL
jgi:hypothetical protein